MKLTQIKDMLAVAAKRSFRAAARDREVTQPAMSRSIFELERELGVVLFERSAHGALPTELGARFIERAGAAMAELQRAADELAQLRGQGSGTVTACLSAGAQARLLPGALAPFRQRWPDVQLRLMEGLYLMAERGLKDGQIDVYVGPEPAMGIDAGLTFEPLYDNPLVVLGRRQHPLAAARSLHELRDANWMGATMGRQVDNLQAAFEAHGLGRPKVVMLCETTTSLVLALAHADVLALAPRSLLDLAPRSELQEICIEDAFRGPQAVLVHRTGLPLTPAAEYFCDMLRRANEHRARDDD